MTRTDAHSDGEVHDFSIADNVSWQVTYDQDWLTGTGEEIIAMGTDQYLAGTAVDGARHDISGEIVVGSQVITGFCFLSLRFNDGRLTGIAFLSEYFDVQLTVDGEPDGIDSFSILTPGAQYAYDAYDPVFHSPLDPVAWRMDSQAEGGEYLVYGLLRLTEKVIITGQGEVTHTYDHSGGGNAGFVVGDSVSLKAAINRHWLTGSGVEVIAMGTDQYISGTAVDGLRRKFPCEIIVGDVVIDTFSFVSLRFQNGTLTGMAFLSNYFQVTVTEGGNPLYDDNFRIITPGAQYGNDSYSPEFQSALDTIKWFMDSQGEGGEHLVRGVLDITP